MLHHDRNDDHARASPSLAQTAFTLRGDLKSLPEKGDTPVRPLFYREAFAEPDILTPDVCGAHHCGKQVIP